MPRTGATSQDVREKIHEVPFWRAGIDYAPCPARVFALSQIPMHEMSLIESIMNILEDEKAKRNLGRITRVTLQNGALAGVVTDSMYFAWEALSPGTEFEGCELVVVETPLKLECQCGTVFMPEDTRYTPCPDCGAVIGHGVLEGREFLIQDIEAEEAGQPT